jgi:hypothetical protein
MSSKSSKKKKIQNLEEWRETGNLIHRWQREKLYKHFVTLCEWLTNMILPWISKHSFKHLSNWVVNSCQESVQIMYSNIIHHNHPGSNQDILTKWKGKETVIYSYYGILLSNTEWWAIKPRKDRDEHSMQNAQLKRYCGKVYIITRFLFFDIVKRPKFQRQYFFVAVLELELRASSLLGKCSNT